MVIRPELAKGVKALSVKKFLANWLTKVRPFWPDVKMPQLSAARNEDDRGLSECLHHKRPVFLQPEALARSK